MKTLFASLSVCLLAGSLACATPTGGTASGASSQPAGRSDASRPPWERIKKPEAVDYKAEVQARSHQSIGVHYLRDGQVALAIRELRAAEKLNPAEKWIQLALAEAYRRRALLEDAEHHVLMAIAVDPEFQEALLTLSGLYVQAERYEEAIVHARTLANDPTFPKPWMALTNQGYAEMKLGRRADARKSLELALAYHEGYWRSNLNLAILDSEEGQSLDAIRRLERVAEISPGALGTAEANYRIGEIYVGVGKLDRAVHHFAAAASQRPSGTWGKRSEVYLERLR